MVNVKELKKGNYIVLDNEPLLITNIEFDISGKTNLELQGLFSGKVISKRFQLHEKLQDADIIRKCATIITKSKNKLQIIDSVTFETIEVDIDENLLEQADENDAVTYIQFRDSAKVIELRKQ